jgi:hypothetical protein
LPGACAARSPRGMRVHGPVAGGTLAAVETDSLAQVAALLRERNAIDVRLAQIINRPMTSGHLGEWIAAQIFDIALEPSAAAAGVDGCFSSGPLQGRTVNIKWYLKREGLLDTTESTELDYYLVLTGPRSPAKSSRGTIRPWCIQAVYVFQAQRLRSVQQARGVKHGVASSATRPQWEAAEIYPTATNIRLAVTGEQAEQLRIFAP